MINARAGCHRSGVVRASGKALRPAADIVSGSVEVNCRVPSLLGVAVIADAAG
ncbi:MAG: hypothetical protein ABTR92_05360 [Candidatus Accumulibacter phosphatis]